MYVHVYIILYTESMCVMLFMAVVAGTTEKVFQDKVRLFDIFVDNQNITSHRAVLDPLLRVTSADEERFEHLNNIR